MIALQDYKAPGTMKALETEECLIIETRKQQHLVEMILWQVE